MTKNDLMTKIELLRAACCVAGVDGRAGKIEKMMLAKLAADAGIEATLLAKTLRRAETEEDFYATQFRKVTTDPEATLEFLFQFALTDRVLTIRESNVLYRLAMRLGVSEERFEALRKAALRQISLPCAG